MRIASLFLLSQRKRKSNPGIIREKERERERERERESERERERERRCAVKSKK